MQKIEPSLDRLTRKKGRIPCRTCCIAKLGYFLQIQKRIHDQQPEQPILCGILNELCGIRDNTSSCDII